MSDIYLLASKCIYAQQSNALIEVQGKRFVYMECYKLSTGSLLLRNDTPIFMELQINNIRTHLLTSTKMLKYMSTWKFVHMHER